MTLADNLIYFKHNKKQGAKKMEWIEHPTDSCVDCSQPKSINLDTGVTRCDTPICRAAADLGAITEGNDFLGEHFQVVVIK